LWNREQLVQNNAAMHDALPYTADIRHARVFWVQKGGETVYIDWGEMQYCVVIQQRFIQFS